jgi:hypothetical protein
MTSISGLKVASRAARVASLAVVCGALMSCGGGEDPAARADAERNAQRFLASDRVFGDCLQRSGEGVPGALMSISQLGVLAERTRSTIRLCQIVAARPEPVERALRSHGTARAMLGEGVTPIGVTVDGAGRMVAGRAVGVPYTLGGPNAWIYSRSMERVTAGSAPVPGHQGEFLYLARGSSNDGYWYAAQRARCAIISGDAQGASELVPAFVLGVGAPPAAGAPLTPRNQDAAGLVVDWMRIGRQPAQTLAFWQSLSPAARATIERVIRDAPDSGGLRHIYRGASDSWWRTRPPSQVNWSREEYFSCAAWYPNVAAAVGPPPSPYFLYAFHLN